MVFSLPQLPYSYGALEPHIDTETMTIHHTKHHSAYISKVNDALMTDDTLKAMTLLDLNKAVGTSQIPDSLSGAVRNNGGGHWNHSFFWKVMGSPADNNGPSDALKSAIDSAFGSIDQMKEKFNAAGATRFGSGWAWLGVKDGKLVVTSTPNQDNPLMECIVETPCLPILGIDVWEHAYYLKYQNRRPEYLMNWWNVVNWEIVNTNFEDAMKGNAPQV